MTQLVIYADARPGHPEHTTVDAAEIRRALAEAGIGYDQWPVHADPDVLATYRPQIDRLCAEGGYVKFDVVRLGPDHPDRVALRQKFISEHTHAEDEVRIFVEGSGLFCLHIEDRVYALRAEAGDLVRVPAGTRHWFDTGESPNFAAIRLFVDPAGWIADYTGSDIGQRFPTL